MPVVACNFLTLDAVEPKRWGFTEVRLFEEALAERAQAPDAPMSRLVDDIVGEVRRQCLDSPTAGLRLVGRVLSHAQGPVARSFALDVLGEVCSEWWLLDEEEQHELYDVIVRARELDVGWRLQVDKVLEVIGQQSDLCHLSRSPFRLRPVISRSGFSQSQPNLLRSQALSSQRTSSRGLSWARQSVWERESIPKDPPKKPIPWWQPRQVPWLTGQPAFPGQQFKAPCPAFRSVGRYYFENYQRCHPSTF
ncbi:unnamed protein product [Symbiodinium natans]|uniref:Uncharacterized protein n=1 Tax=Symbiodinium natans TaxID=878477 RepID=A0A812LUN2_9DINO|nr:unnamed protein product [Symbiodinium natans]